ncbi:MAG: protein kinase domain-containing protein [Gemmatimonadaceae bacterium]
MPDPVVSSSDAELNAHIERVLSANYEVDREIGRGGFGIVYRAKDRRLKRPVAIKLLPPELAFRSEIRTRFLREAETAAQLSHPNIVPIYAVDEREGLVFFVMGLVEGDNVAKRLHDRGALDVSEARRILREVADALAYAHARGVIHRDIKPDNIILDRDTGRPMVTDFGIAKAVAEGDSRLTATGMALGTPAYMSPEQAAGEREIDGRSDLYSLGIVGYQMLCGDVPFQANNTPAMLVKHLSERPRPVDERREGLPPDLARAVMMLLEKDPNDRFPSAQALVVALESGNVPESRTSASRGALAGDPAAGAGPQGYGVASAPRPTGGYGGAPSWGAPSYPATAEGAYGIAEPTPDEITRWNAPPVVKFRRSVAPYIWVNAAIVVFSGIFGDGDALGITTVWSVFMAFRYAKLWADGYDWRDVFKQPRDRMFADAVGEIVDHLKAFWDPRKREELRQRDRAQRAVLARVSSGAIGAGTQARPAGALAQSGDLTRVAGTHAGTVRSAMDDRNEILRVFETMPKKERESLPDVVASANALYQKVEGIAVALAELDRNAVPDAAGAIDAEISQLEAQANPLDRAASEERVRRLAYLKRQRRAVADVEQRRRTGAAKLESCALALHNLRLDVLRLRTGNQSYENITLVAERAMSLAREVDSQLYVQDELARALGPRSSLAGARPGTR